MSWEVKVVDDIAIKIHRVTVHTFDVGDVEDPEIYAAGPIIQWQESEAGEFVMNNAVDVPEYHQYLDYNTYGYRYAITAKLKEADYLIWTLKFKD